MMARPHAVCAVRPGTLRLIVAVFVLAARLLGSGPSHALAVAGTGLEWATICHAGEVSAALQPSKPPAHDPAHNPSHDQDCLRCPVCVLAAAALLPVVGATVPLPVAAALSAAAAAPPAMGPPPAAGLVPPPTGPPARPV